MALTNNFGNSSAVKQYYENYLGRSPTESEIQWWLANHNSTAEIQTGITASPEARTRAEGLVRQIYGSIGRTGIGGAVNQIDPGGFEAWVNHFLSGKSTAANLQADFDVAVNDYMTQNPNDQYTTYVKSFKTANMTDGEIWRAAESSGDYSEVAKRINGLSKAEVKSRFGLSDADLAYVYSRPGIVAPQETATDTTTGATDSTGLNNTHVIALGDSTTFGYNAGNQLDTNMVSSAQSALGNNYTIDNFGVNSTTVGDLLTGENGTGSNWVNTLASDAGVVVLNYGMNEAYRGEDPATFAANLTKAVNDLKAAGKTVILQTPNIATGYDWAANVPAYADVIRNVASATGSALDDKYATTSGMGDIFDPATGDTIHPSSTAYAALGGNLANVISGLNKTNAANSTATNTAANTSNATTSTTTNTASTLTSQQIANSPYTGPSLDIMGSSLAGVDFSKIDPSFFDGLGDYLESQKTPEDRIYEELQRQSKSLGTEKEFQTGAAGSTEGGLGSTDAVMRDMAKKLADAGLTSIEQFGQGKVPVIEKVRAVPEYVAGTQIVSYSENGPEYNQVPSGRWMYEVVEGVGENTYATRKYIDDSEVARLGLSGAEPKVVEVKTGEKDAFINKATGEPLTSLTGYDGRGWSGTSAGDGQTIYNVKFDESTGLPMFYNQQKHGKDDYAGLLKVLAIGTAIFAPQIGAALLPAGSSAAAALAVGSAVSGLIGSGGDIKSAIKAGLASYLGGVAGSWASRTANSALVGTIATNMTRAAILGGDMEQALVASLVQAAPAEIIKQFPSFSQLPRAAQEAAVAATVDLMRTGGENLGQIALQGATKGATDYVLSNIEEYKDLRPAQKEIVRTRVSNVLGGADLSDELLHGAISFGTEAVQYQINDEKAKKDGWTDYETQQAAKSLYGDKVTPALYADKQETTEAEAKEIARAILGREPTEFEYMQLVGLSENDAAQNSDLAGIRYNEADFSSNELIEAYKGLYGKEPSAEWLAENMDLLGRSEAQGKNMLQNLYIQDKNTTNNTEAEALWKEMGNTGPIPAEILFQMLAMPESGAKSLAEDLGSTTAEEATAFLRQFYGKDYQPTEEQLQSLVGKRPEASVFSDVQTLYNKDKNWVTEDEAKKFWKDMGNTGSAPQEFIDAMLMTSEAGAKAMAETYRITSEDQKATTFDGSGYDTAEQAKAAAVKAGYNSFTDPDTGRVRIILPEDENFKRAQIARQVLDAQGLTPATATAEQRQQAINLAGSVAQDKLDNTSVVDLMADAGIAGGSYVKQESNLKYYLTAPPAASEPKSFDGTRYATQTDAAIAAASRGQNTFSWTDGKTYKVPAEIAADGKSGALRDRALAGDLVSLANAFARGEISNREYKFLEAGVKRQTDAVNKLVTNRDLKSAQEAAGQTVGWANLGTETKETISMLDRASDRVLSLGEGAGNFVASIGQAIAALTVDPAGEGDIHSEFRTGVPKMWMDPNNNVVTNTGKNVSEFFTARYSDQARDERKEITDEINRPGATEASIAAVVLNNLHGYSTFTGSELAEEIIPFLAGGGIGAALKLGTAGLVALTGSAATLGDMAEVYGPSYAKAMEDSIKRGDDPATAHALASRVASGNALITLATEGPLNFMLAKGLLVDVAKNTAYKVGGNIAAQMAGEYIETIFQKGNEYYVMNGKAPTFEEANNWRGEATFGALIAGGTTSGLYVLAAANPNKVIGKDYDGNDFTVVDAITNPSSFNSSTLNVNATLIDPSTGKSSDFLSVLDKASTVYAGGYNTEITESVISNNPADSLQIMRDMGLANWSSDGKITFSNDAGNIATAFVLSNTVLPNTDGTFAATFDVSNLDGVIKTDTTVGTGSDVVTGGTGNHRYHRNDNRHNYRAANHGYHRNHRRNLGRNRK
jgi:lysophospholipase L1-like esterase